MEKFQLWAQPWWVNLLALVPGIAFFLWRKRRPALLWRQLFFLTLFAAAFGFVEAAVVVYLRAAVGLLPGYHGTLADVQRASQNYAQDQSIQEFPLSLLTVELFREAATILMLAAVAGLAAPRSRERWACFLWAFAGWDIAYYAGLWATVRWPRTLTDFDVLFLIPVPWLSQVWFPLAVSALMMLVIAISRSRESVDPGLPGHSRVQ